MNKIMKKQYISPEAIIEEMELEGLIATSIDSVSTDTTNPIPVGGDADNGPSDSRFGLWDDGEY